MHIASLVHQGLLTVLHIPGSITLLSNQLAEDWLHEGWPNMHEMMMIQPSHHHHPVNDPKNEMRRLARGRNQTLRQ